MFYGLKVIFFPSWIYVWIIYDYKFVVWPFYLLFVSGCEQDSSKNIQISAFHIFKVLQSHSVILSLTTIFKGWSKKIQIWAIPFPMTLLFPHNCVLPHCVMLLELEPLFHRASTLLAVSFSWAMATLWRGGHHFNKHVPYHVEFFLPY